MKNHFIKQVGLIALLSLLTLPVTSQSSYELWLSYSQISDRKELQYATNLFKEIALFDQSETSVIIRNEVKMASQRLTSHSSRFLSTITKNTGMILASDTVIIEEIDPLLNTKLRALEPGAFIIQTTKYKGRKRLLICANSSTGLLYGTFHMLRSIQIGKTFSDTALIESPKVSLRILNHWDNLDRTVERGYAGFSIWDWHRLPGYIDQRYIDYARANASIGINGTVLTNVNANALILTEEYISKVKALADVFRPYGIRVYLTARFSAPIEIGKLPTADPFDPAVREWWNSKAAAIYASIPDFGGFLVKANSEGQPGPQNYNRTHADGANMLAEALKPFGGIVMWRAFVYSNESPEDRAKQANLEFEHLDGQFAENVFIQVKNGAIDFQPREPFHPLFGALNNTPVALEFQITQEYLGQGTSLCYLAPLYKECLESRTFRPQNESRVADVINGSAYNDPASVIAGVANIGNDLNWTGHLFGQSNWYAFGRLAWDSDLSSEEIASEWIMQSITNDQESIETILSIMLKSRETVVNYMTPLGLHHIMGRNHHYGPGPWVNEGRADWTSVYYHKADSLGIGFDRTMSGSNAISQYAREAASIFSDPESCPEKYLLWFHHLPWTYKLKNGSSLWKELCVRYNTGVLEVENMNTKWKTLECSVEKEKFEHVAALLQIQLDEAKWWRNSCLLYFQQYSGLPFPEGIIIPEKELQEYIDMRFPYAPGIKPTW